MNQVFGEFDDALQPNREYLILGFSPSAKSIRQRWRNNGLSANFLTDYMTTFFPADEPHREPKRNTQSRCLEMQDAVRYIANELLENAMKFHDDVSRQPITIKLQLHPNRIVFWVTNSVKPEAIAPFQRFIQELLAAQPLELYVQQLEQNALSDEHTTSGIGLLTMMVDYKAIVGWKFTQLEQSPPVTTVTTRVQVPI
ncbi:MAG: DUF6272 family protein [Cyanobacteria bacterium J069]|nr:MAG: ATP-binding protein [Cyanobacteria bacterium J069]